MAHVCKQVRFGGEFASLRTDPYASFAFDATYTFLVAANNLMHQGLNAARLAGGCCRFSQQSTL